MTNEMTIYKSLPDCRGPSSARFNSRIFLSMCIAKLVIPEDYPDPLAARTSAHPFKAFARLMPDGLPQAIEAGIIAFLYLPFAHLAPSPLPI